MVKARTWDIRECDLSGVHRDGYGRLILCASCTFENEPKECEYCAVGVCEKAKEAKRRKVIK